MGGSNLMKKVTLSLLGVSEMSPTVNTSNSLISRLLEIENSGGSSIIELSMKINVKLLQSKIDVNVSVWRLK